MKKRTNKNNARIVDHQIVFFHFPLDTIVSNYLLFTLYVFVSSTSLLTTQGPCSPKSCYHGLISHEYERSPNQLLYSHIFHHNSQNSESAEFKQCNNLTSFPASLVKWLLQIYMSWSKCILHSIYWNFP